MSEGFCSWCFEKTSPTTVEDCMLERNLLECSHCKKIIVKCRACNNYAKWGTITFVENGKETKKRIRHQFCAEHQHEMPNFETANVALAEPSDYRVVYNYASPNLVKVARMAGISLASAAVVGPLALYMAPTIGGAIGVSMGYSGAVATNVGLATLGGGALAAGGAGMAGGLATITGLGGVLGGGLGAYIGNAYLRSVKDFSIEKVRDGCNPALITINGLLSNASDGYGSWTKLANSKFKDHAWYHVNWDAKNLADVGKMALAFTGDAAFSAFLKKAASSASKGAAKRVLPIATIYEAVRLGRNPWHVALVQAEHTGFILSDILRRCKQKKFVLVGHSLGCRVIRSCLHMLSEADCGAITDVHLLGGAAGNGADKWERASKAVSGQIFNYKSDNDSILKTLYKAGTFFKSEPIGLHSVDVKGIKNIDVSEYVDGHMKYKDYANLFLEVR